MPRQTHSFFTLTAQSSIDCSFAVTLEAQRRQACHRVSGHLRGTLVETSGSPLPLFATYYREVHILATFYPSAGMSDPLLLHVCQQPYN